MPTLINHSALPVSATIVLYLLAFSGAVAYCIAISGDEDEQ